MSNTVITNYTDLNGPSTRADSSVVVIVNKDGSLSVDQNLLGTLMGTEGSQGAGISVVRVGHEGRPDDATDSESEDDKIPHVTLSVDSYFDVPNSIIKYDSGAEMLQSLKIETRENSLVGFQNDHCYTPLTSPSQGAPQRSDSFSGYDEPVIEITHTPPPKPVPQSKKITILDQKILPRGRKIPVSHNEGAVILKGNDAINKPLNSSKAKLLAEAEQSSESTESSSISSGESIPDRDSDSDYKDTKDRSGSLRSRKSKLKPRILKNAQPSKASKLDAKVSSRLKSNKNLIRREFKEKIQQKISLEKKQSESDLSTVSASNEGSKGAKYTPKPVKKEKKTPAHMTALLTDMSSLFSTPDVIRRVSMEGKTPGKPERKGSRQESTEEKVAETQSLDKSKIPKTGTKPKGYDLPGYELDEASLAQILQDTSTVPSSSAKVQPNMATGNTINLTGLAGPLSPTLDILGGLQPEEEGLTEDLLMHVAQLVESSENLQEVIDKQVLGKVDTTLKAPLQQTQVQTPAFQTPVKSVKTITPRQNPIEIVRRDGRVITLPPIEAPATRASKRKSQLEAPGPNPADIVPTPPAPAPPPATPPEPPILQVSKQYVNKKLTAKKQELSSQSPAVDKISAESQESWNSEDDPNRLWCICRQPHNNRFMICCDNCEDWFHGKCVNITKAMGQQMELQGIEWRCPICVKKTKGTPKSGNKLMPQKLKMDESPIPPQVILPKDSAKTNCIVCKKPARATSIYCSDACILKHAQDSLSPIKPENDSGKPQEKKSDSRVIVYERKSGRLLAGPNAPTAENLKTWLQKNPTFEVVRPGALSAIKPNVIKKKPPQEGSKVQTTLNFERIPRKSLEQPSASTSLLKSPPGVGREKMVKVVKSGVGVGGMGMGVGVRSPPPRPAPPTPRPSPATPRPSPSPAADKKPATPRPTPSPAADKKPAPRATTSRSLSTYEKAPAVSPSTSRRKEAPDAKKMVDSTETIRDNVKKALQEQLTLRMAEHKGPKFTDQEIKQFALDTENELHDLFRDVGMKYKAKYRSLMFNIKDRKNLTLWQKICDRTITASQLVRFSAEELASQELAQWRDKEAKHQLELIKKSELDLLAASKTYVLKTHKGEEVMETKESVSTELDPNVPVEDLVTALNDSTVGDLNESIEDKKSGKDEAVEKRTRKRDRGDSPTRSKKSKKESKRDSSRLSRSSRRSGARDERAERRSGPRDQRDRRSDRKKSRARSPSREKRKSRTSRDKSSRRRSPSRSKSKRRSKSRAHSRSASKGRAHSPAPASRRSARHAHAHTEEEKKPRSKSQEPAEKNKNESTDSDSIERPKSAMLKESHPEYDPHEPMITSAFSEEDLRKSGGDSFDDSPTYTGTDYDKSFSIDSSIILPTVKYSSKHSEAESDQEPSSTVENAPVTVWNGCINMVDVARFYVAAHEVSGSGADLEEDLGAELDVVGRINPSTVWEYIIKMKKTSTKDIVVLKLVAANDEEKMQYIALYSYLSSRNRLGVVKVSASSSLKDFYVVPLAANTPPNPALLPLRGPGLGDTRTHSLLAILIRNTLKRTTNIPKDTIPAKMARTSRKRSYTPPIVGKSALTPPTSPKRRSALPLPYTSPALSASVKDKIASSLASADNDEPYSPGSSTSSGSGPSAPAGPNLLRSKMEELNRQIEEQKQQIMKMAQADSSVGEDEAYSPSRPMTPPPVVPLADIALPSNLQEILATIKQRSETTTTDVDMRNLPLP